MNYLEDHNRLVAYRDHKDGHFRVRVDYMANGDSVTFYIDGDKTFIVSKKILHKTANGITYTIVVKNIGDSAITDPICLYSDNNGVFTINRVFQRDVVGKQVFIKTLRPNQQVRFMFLIKQITKSEEAYNLIQELTDNTVYGRKILSIFERLDAKLTGDKNLFLEGIKHNPYVMNYASDELRKDTDLATIYTEMIIEMECNQ